jgi:hypothetical protein
MTTRSLLKPLTICLMLAITPLSISKAQAAVKVGSYVGTWRASTIYVAGDLITFSNKTFLSLVKNKAKDPIKNPKVWQVLGGVGADGVGVIGSQGLPGVQGVAGPKGDTGLQGPIGANGAVGPQGATGVPQSGTGVGNMQYWNGTSWVEIKAPAKEPATLRFKNGVPIWMSNYIIGDIGPAGGKVFYVTDNTGLHGLEAAPADQSSGVQWGCYFTTISGADGTAVGTGAANTTDIVAGCAEANTAAKIADAYALNGYTDWYLPSKDELNLLYQQKAVVGGFANNYYWSSSQFNSYNAWNQNFINGNQNSNYYKDNTLPVRAVRAF